MCSTPGRNNMGHVTPSQCSMHATLISTPSAAKPSKLKPLTMVARPAKYSAATSTGRSPKKPVRYSKPAIRTSAQGSPAPISKLHSCMQASLRLKHGRRCGDLERGQAIPTQKMQALGPATPARTIYVHAKKPRGFRSPTK